RTRSCRFLAAPPLLISGPLTPLQPLSGCEYRLRKKNEGIVRICSWDIASIRPLLKKKANFLPEFMRDYGLDVLCL
ncbi:MAG: hypothetical protein AAFU83_04675, partial [Bacteroidota bacterium]